MEEYRGLFYLKVTLLEFEIERGPNKPFIFALENLANEINVLHVFFLILNSIFEVILAFLWKTKMEN